MIILRKLFSSRKKNKKLENDVENKGPRDANIMTQAGKVGLAGASGLGLMAGVEATRSAMNAPKIINDLKEIKTLKDNPYIRKEVKSQIKRIPYPGASDVIVDKVRWIEKNPPKFSKLDKIEKGWRYLNKGSKLSRTVLQNAENYSGLAVEGLQNKYKGKLNEAEVNALKKVPKSVGRVANSLLHFKNAKLLGRGALALGSAGGLLYLNGRSLQEGSDRPIK